MVAIRRPKKQDSLLSGRNLLILFLVSQLFAGIYFASSGSKNDDAAPAAAVSAGIKERLGSSMENIKKKKAEEALQKEEEPVKVQEVEVHEEEEPVQEEHEEEVVEDNEDADSHASHEEVGDGNNNKDEEQHEEEQQEEEIHHAQMAKEEMSQEIADEQAGTHAAANYYFADYIYERENPPFRMRSVSDWDESHDAIVTQLPNVSAVRSCQYKSDAHALLHHAKCKQEGTKLVAYNAASFERQWCGVTIGPGKAAEIPKYCSDPVQLFAKAHPPVNGEGMPPMVIASTPQTGADTKLKDVTCDIPCQHEDQMKNEERYVVGTAWKLLVTMNDPMKHANAQVERTAFRQDVYYSTSSFKSSVPLSFFSFDDYNIFTPAVDFDSVDASGSYLVDSQCASHFTKRNRWADAVLGSFPTKFYGSCGHNADVPAGTNLRLAADRTALLKKHRFNLAFEFGEAKDHITPVVWEAFASGTLPVVLGAGNVKDHFPPNSFVSASGLQHWGDLGTRVADIVKSKEEWSKYQTWRTDPKAKVWFENKYNFTRTGPECRLCRWAYAKKYGLGWSHKQQAVKDTALERKMCLDDESKLISKPFVESWYSVKAGEEYVELAKAADGSKCTEQTSNTLVMTKAIQMKRSVVLHDNVVDIELSNFVKEASTDSIVLRLEIPVRNPEGSYFPNPHALVSTVRGGASSSMAIQDSKSKVIVLASWNTEITSLKEGVVEVIVRKSDEQLLHEEDETRRIRVIIEDMVELYDKATEFYPTSFAKHMVQDFVDPLELFYID
mmetsp:Transcript_14471/g.23953  ORF Transcript_14471/g.23953 Transcript_14471/m.23953 type:complete len:781 (-) Transcript_14471:42-2384(-)